VAFWKELAADRRSATVTPTPAEVATGATASAVDTPAHD
jgi:hypothetical protein